MSAYKDALHIARDEAGSRLTLAQELLGKCRGVVVLAAFVALRPVAEGILVEVISDSPTSDPTSLADAARELLENATLVLPSEPCALVIVDDYGTGTQEIWRAV